MLAYFDVPTGWKELARRTIKETLSGDVPGLAAQLAYYFLFALFPALLFLIALASYFPLQNLTDEVISLLGPFAPNEIISLIKDQMVKLSEGDQGGLLSLGLLGALWSSSAALSAIIGPINRAYDIEEGRSWWKVRLSAVCLTIGLAVFILLSLMLVLGGPELANLLAARLGLGSAFEWTWKIMQWPVVFVLVATGIGLIYYFAPDAEQDWVWITPGSVLATTLWLAASLGFRFYVVNFGSYEETYGALGAVIILMLWFYLTGLAILVGAELNAEIEHASPWGKAPGEKVPGEKRKIGAAAARAHREQSARFEAARPAARQARGAPSFPRGGWAGTTGVFCKLF